MTGRDAVVVRAAQRDDEPTVRRISAEAYLPAYAGVIDGVPRPATADYREPIGAGDVWIATLRGIPAGVLVVENRADHLYVYSIAVVPRWQRHGIGARLLDHAGSVAALRGYRALRLSTNAKMTRNIEFYRRHGFDEVMTSPHEFRPSEVSVELMRSLD